MGLEYVDIFYSHRPDPETPLEETMGALDFIVRSGRALYVGISSYNPEQTRQATTILQNLGTPCIIHQPRYNMFDRWIEDGLLDVLSEKSIGCIGFSPLCQGILTDKYLEDVPEETLEPGNCFLHPQTDHSQCGPVVEQHHKYHAPGYVREIHRRRLTLMKERVEIVFADQLGELGVGGEIGCSQRGECGRVEIRLFTDRHDELAGPVHQQRAAGIRLEQEAPEQACDRLEVVLREGPAGSAMGHSDSLTQC